jgi:fructooligosaccharide transport system substrate-binding protein
MKRIGLAVVIFAVMVLPLSGRGADESTGGQEAAGPSGEVTALTFQYGEDSTAKEAIDKILVGFYKQHPAVDVSFVNVPYNEYENRLKISFASGDPHDIVWMDAPNIASYAEEEVLHPLDEFWSSDDFSDLVQSAQNGMRYNGKIWAAPLNEANVCVWYNKDLTNAAGLNPPESLENAWSWEEFYGAAKALTKKDSSGKVEVYGILPAMGAPVVAHEGITFTVVQWLWQAGGQVLSADGKQAEGYFNNAAGVEALTYYQRFFQEGLAPLQDIASGFETGKIAMYVTGPWQLGYMRSDYPEFNLGITPLPIGKQGASPTGSWNLGITAKSDNKTAAWEVIHALTGKEGSAVWCGTTKDIPARKSTFQESTMFEADQPLSVVKEQLLNNGKPRPVTPAYPKISEYLSKAFNDVAFGEDPKATADKYAAKMQAALDEYFGN